MYEVKINKSKANEKCHLWNDLKGENNIFNKCLSSFNNIIKNPKYGGNTIRKLYMKYVKK